MILLNDENFKTKICKYTAQGGYLEGLKYARENGCPWDESTCSSAAQGGYI